MLGGFMFYVCVYDMNISPKQGTFDFVYVGDRGFEPLTSTTSMLRSTN